MFWILFENATSDTLSWYEVKEIATEGEVEAGKSRMFDIGLFLASGVEEKVTGKTESGDVCADPSDDALLNNEATAAAVFFAKGSIDGFVDGTGPRELSQYL